MFQNSYQNGTHFEVFDPKTSQDKSKNLYRMQNVNANNKVFQKNLKTFIFQFNNANSRIIFPKEEKKQLYLIQQYLNLQIYFSSAIDWNIQLTVSDLTHTKRRIIISPSVHKIQKKPFFVKFPCTLATQGIWMNFCIDMFSFIQAFKGQTYRSLDMIQITGNFKLRRIFTTHNLIPQLSTLEQNSLNILPKHFSFPQQVSHENIFVFFQNNFLTEQASQRTQTSSKSGSRLISSKSIKRQAVLKKSLKQIKEQKQLIPQKQTKSMKKVLQTEKNIDKKEKVVKNQKEFLANTNGLQIIRNKKQLNQNSDTSKQKGDIQIKTPMSTSKNVKRKQPLAKTQVPKIRSSIQKRNSIKQNQQKQKAKIKQRQKLNPWRSSNKNNNETQGYKHQKIQNQRKIQTAEASLIKSKNNLAQRMNDSKNRGFERKSDCYSDSQYVELSQKFSTVTQGRFFKNQLSKNMQFENEDSPLKSNDEIEQNIQIQANSFYENSNKKQNKVAIQLQQKQKLVQQSINDSLDIYNKNEKKIETKMENQSQMNMSSRHGFGQKMMNKYMKQFQRPYSPPLGERQHTEDQQSKYRQQQDKQVQLMYDPVLNCYYDHRTHTYYELKN